MQVFLELSGHPQANVRRVVVTRTTLIGRSRECALQIASAGVSRKHCELRVSDEGVSVVDLGSSNGTFIDADRLPPGEARPLPPGSRLNVGGIRFVVTYTAPAAKAVEDSPLPVETAAPAVVATPTTAAAVADEPILVDEPLFAEEEPILFDEPILDDEESAAATPAPVPVKAQAVEIDDEPDLSAMFADEPEERASAPTAPAAVGVEEDEPILGSDEDDAFAFLTDDEEEAPVGGAARPEDSRLTR
jgi:pSer/pThr/pTyr-binding forkhead associated (FHA) protein